MTVARTGIITARWMWADAGLIGRETAKMNPLRWSSASSIDNTIRSLETYQVAKGSRPVKVWLQYDSQRPGAEGVTLALDHIYSDVSQAIAGLQNYPSCSTTGDIDAAAEEMQVSSSLYNMPERILCLQLDEQSTISVRWTSGEGLNSLSWSKVIAPMEETKLKCSEFGSVKIHAYCKQSKQEREIELQSLEIAKSALLAIVQGEDARCPQADVVKIIDGFRMQQAVVRREATAWPPEKLQAERCFQCICCGKKSRESCDVCGLALCSQCVSWHPLTAGMNSTKQIRACHVCRDAVDNCGEARAAQRMSLASEYRAVLAGSIQGFLPVRIPTWEEAEDCAACGIRFSVNKVMLNNRHHCRACGRSLCSKCLCGDFTCLGTPLKCPHKGLLPQYGYEKEEKICKECLPINNMRILARNLLKDVAVAGMDNAQHYGRVATFLESPTSLPLYEQEYEDTTRKKISRVGDFAASASSYVTPVLSMPAAACTTVVSALWKHGQYGLAALLFSNEIFESLMILQSLSSAVQRVEVKDLLVGAIYLNAEQRFTLRSSPNILDDEAMANGKPVDSDLLGLLIELAGLGLCVPYEESPFEAQRLALQQRWRLISERLKTSRKHRPAWCLYIHEEQKIACLTIRGTDLEKSIGGDLFTDVDAMPVPAMGMHGVRALAHSGMLESARMLERELRPTFRLLYLSGYKISIMGHSLGAGVSALLTWLLKNGADGEMLPQDARIFGVGYATPSVVDRHTSEMMKPYFATVVNSFDLVPRLSVFNVKTLAGELVQCAKNSKSDLEEDVQCILDRAAGLWAPRLRTGRQGQPVSRQHSIDEAANVLPARIHSKLRNYTKRVTATFTGVPLRPVYGVLESTPSTSKLGDFRMLPSTGFEDIYKLFPASCSARVLEAEVPPVEPAEETQIIECAEGSVFRVFGGPDAIDLAWYGDAKHPWQENHGKICTDKVRKHVHGNFSMPVINSLLGDPCPGKFKKLIVLTKPVGHEFDLFSPGRVVWIYRHHGSLKAAEVPCDIPSLRRIVFDTRMVVDHKAASYHEALLSARAQLTATKNVVWQSFAEADYCPRCHNVHQWHRTGKSMKQRWLAMTNCRACGLVVCTECAKTRQAIPDAGILIPQRICDSCYWRGQVSHGRPELALSAVFENAIK